MSTPPASRTRGEWRPAPSAPVARVVVDVGLAHLDRPFDYRVPAHLDDVAVPGVRVRVRFAGRLVDGFLLERADESAHVGRLAWVDKVVSPEPVLTPEVERLCRAVADRQAGMLTDVLRLAVPPRHARVEKETPRERAALAGAPGTGPRRLGRLPARVARCSTPCPAGGSRTPSGRRCPARTGRPGSPRPRRDGWRPAGVRCSWSPTSATSTRCRRPARPGSARTAWSR